ncbi:TPA: hypothetical protein DEB72_03170 [Patescibacteria group bacterium]|nr:hypothetical protein [Patescibacteria group bacterium]
MPRQVFAPYRSAWRAHQLPRRQPRKLPRRRWVKAISVALALGAILAIGLFVWAARDLPTPEGIAHRVVPQSTKIYDRTSATVLYDIHGEERRTSVELKDVPILLQQATLTAEDRTFYEHQGFRFTSMLRSVIVNVLAGGKVQGGSTITQQFIKNAIVGGEKSYIRKIKEIILAYQIERKFSKDEILKLYFNEIPYGSNAYGAEAAAQLFFGKSVRDINLAEAAVLAAIPKAPSYYSPWGIHQDELIGRQQYIIQEMVGQGYIDQTQADAATAYELEFVTRQENIIAPHFVFMIKEQVAEKYGERAVEQGGLKIITTIDLDAQRAAEQAIASGEEKNNSYDASNASLVAIDVSTGQILALVGSRDFFNEDISGQVNVAARPRQPGSSFKPVVYGTSFTQGFSPETVLFDVVTTFKTDIKDYTPHNYDDKEHGPVTLRQALAGSLNIPAVKLLYLTGVEKVLDTAELMGYSTFGDRRRFGLSLVLGGAEVKLIDHVNGFATLARDGQYLPYAGILKIEDANGKTLEEFKQPAAKEALPPPAARQVTNILSDNNARAYIFGASNYLTLPDRPVAAKTGTTNDYHDAWTLGYTPKLAAGVWVGNSNNDAMKRGADGSVVAAPIWQSFMKQVLANQPVESFTEPEPSYVDKPMLNGQVTGSDVLIDRASGRLATDLTPVTYIVRKRYRQYHTILHYLDKNNPLSNDSFNPADDPQYVNWESAVRRWSAANGFIDEQPPTAYDNVHTLANRPNIQIISPSSGSSATTNPLELKVNVSAPRGVARVEYYLDNQLIGEAKQYPFSYLFSVTDDWANGYHTLTAKVYDDIDNLNQAQTVFSLLVTPLPSPYHANWQNPIDGANLNLSDGAVPIQLTFDQPELLTKADIFYKFNQGSSSWLGVIENPSSAPIIQWLPPQAGNYTLFLVLQDRLGISKTTKPINITIND